MLKYSHAQSYSLFSTKKSFYNKKEKRRLPNKKSHKSWFGLFALPVAFLLPIMREKIRCRSRGNRFSLSLLNFNEWLFQFIIQRKRPDWSSRPLTRLFCKQKRTLGVRSALYVCMYILTIRILEDRIFQFEGHV